MVVDNAAIARTFDTLADLLEIEGANPFRVRAYRNAARLVEGLPQAVPQLLAEGRDLDDYPGIGRDLAGKIRAVAESGTLPLLEEVKARTPEVLSTMTHIAGLGPKRVKQIYETLHVASLDDLAAEVEAGHLRELPGFGERTEGRVR
jgi:DNA polymerase (family 10)